MDMIEWSWVIISLGLFGAAFIIAVMLIMAIDYPKLLEDFHRRKETKFATREDLYETQLELNNKIKGLALWLDLEPVSMYQKRYDSSENEQFLWVPIKHRRKKRK